ncbi:hypothetical protein R1sor_000871 [Riccia sorocarpa]|uniref:At4g15545-like C-terminal domain-containing protein n=1 Tax=Riccia sorocarpa TaxID=122646 RepID=A0ABD3H0E8_9MARC
MSTEDTSSEDDSTTTIFSTSSQGSAISIMSKNSAELARMKTDIVNSDDQKKEAIALVDRLLEQREEAEHLLEEISKRPPPEPSGDSDRTYLEEDESEESAQSEDSGTSDSTAGNLLLGFRSALTEAFTEDGTTSSKEMFRRMRQRLTKHQFKQFVRNIKELNKLREEREKRKYESYMHPVTFSAWPPIFINIGEWETVPAVF